MGDVVHFKNEPLPLTVECGGCCGVNTNHTYNIEKVTCPECLKKLGVNDVVDEEKVAMAEALIKECVDEYGTCHHCDQWAEDEGHNDDCIVKKAEAYLKSVKGNDEDEKD